MATSTFGYSSRNYEVKDRKLHNFPVILQTLFCFEAIFVLFINIGFIKNNPALEDFPVDLTVLTGGLVACVGLAIGLQRKLRFPKKSIIVSLLCIVLFTLVAGSMTWSSGGEAAVRKAFFQSPLVLLVFLGSALIVATDRARIRRFIYLTIACALFVAFITYNAVEGAGLSGIEHGVKIEGASDSIMRGNALAIGVVIIYCDLLFNIKRKLRSIISLPLIAALMLGVLVTGSRQSLLGVLIVILISLVINPLYQVKRRSSLNVKIILPIMLIIGGYIAVNTYNQSNVSFATISRVSVLLSDSDEDISALARLSYFEYVYEAWLERPIIGHGAGSFGEKYSYIGLATDHPHNILLDFVYDTGTLGLLIFIFLVAFALKGFVGLKKLRGDQIAFTIGFLFLFALTVSMVSSSYADNRLFFCTLGLLCYRSKIN